MTGKFSEAVRRHHHRCAFLNYISKFIQYKFLFPFSFNKEQIT
jgi:hypothetical protein